MIVRKLLVNDGRAEREVLFVGTLVVGRDPDCHLHDLDPLLSRRHAEFVSSAQGAIIRDLKSRNGILVNGNKVPHHALQPGDVIQLGHLNIRYLEERLLKTEDDHTRSHATTATGLETPTMALPSRPADTAVAAFTPAIESEEPTGFHQDARILTPLPDTFDDDATAAPVGKMVALPDLDRTMASSNDATVAPLGRTSSAGATTIRTARATEARIVANSRLIVTEASPFSHDVMGARPDTIVGGRLSDAIERTLLFVSSGDGPSKVSLSIERAENGSGLTVTFTTG